MIALRGWLERTSRRRWVGPLVVILLVLLIAMTMFHTGTDQALEQEGAACIAFVFFVAVTRLVQRLCASPASRRMRNRAPPERSTSTTARFVSSRPVLLRLQL